MTHQNPIHLSKHSPNY